MCMACDPATKGLIGASYVSDLLGVRFNHTGSKYDYGFIADAEIASAAAATPAGTRAAPFASSWRLTRRAISGSLPPAFIVHTSATSPFGAPAPSSGWSIFRAPTAST